MKIYEDASKDGKNNGNFTEEKGCRFPCIHVLVPILLILYNLFVLYWYFCLRH